jgi:hypothetical protein
MQRRKFWCKPCDYVCQAQHKARCPYCREPMTDKGRNWQPGKRGERERARCEPAYYSVYYWPWFGTAEGLLRKIDGEFVFDKRTGRYRVSRPVYDKRTKVQASRPKGRQVNGRSVRRNRSGRVYRRPVVRR